MPHARLHVHHMGKMIQIRHVSDDTHRKLKARAALAGLSLSDYLRREVEALAERPSPEELLDRLAARTVLREPVDIASVLHEEREARGGK